MDDLTTQTWLVLGGTGFLGVHVLKACRAAGLRVVLASRTASSVDSSLVAESLDCDLSIAPSRAFGSLDPDVILNLAALSRVGVCEQNQALAGALNAHLPRVMGERFPRARIVHVSTDLVFGVQPAPASGFSEAHEPKPASVYAATKHAGECALLEARPAALVVRLPLLFGDSFGRAEGATDALLAAVDRGEVPKLFTDEFRSPLDAAEAAGFLVRAGRASWSGLLHRGGPERLSRYELGLRVLSESHGWTPEQAAARLDPVLRADLGLAHRPGDVCLDSSRSDSLLARPNA